MKRKNLIAKNKNRKKLLNYLKKNKYSKIFRDFESLIKKNNIKSFAVAVSGGEDSLALTLISKCYQIKNNSNVYFVHVDHHLRKNSSNEASFVKKNLKKYGIKCDILKWRKYSHLRPTQENARINRYRLLENFCEQKKVKVIVLGHHKGDLSENFFMRMIRGSGLKGLVSFSKSKIISKKGVVYLRPFLKISKKNLSNISRKVFSFSVKDPSNSNDDYLRIRVRKMLKSLRNEGFDNRKFDLTLNNLISSNETIDFYINQNLINNSKLIEKNREKKIILKPDFFNHPKEVVFRSLSNILVSLNDKYYYTRGSVIIRQIDQIKKKNFKKTTMGGCIVERVENSTLIFKEITK